MRQFALRYGETIVYFGDGALNRLGGHFSAHRKILVVTGGRSAKVSGALDDAAKVLTNAGIEWWVYDGVFPNPTDRVVDEIAGAAKERGAEAILAIGGGSVIDSAKFAAVVACSGGRAREYLKGAKNPSCSLPVYAVNLTHGTGSEVDRYSVANVEEEGLKIGLGTVYPRASADDPAYLRTLPAQQTRYTAIDALYHALESATSTARNPMAASLAREAVEIISRWLPAALEDPDDLEARANLLYAAAVAGIAIDNSVTHIVHSLEHVLSGLNPKLPHGAGLALLGPRCMRYVHMALPDESAMVLRPLDPGISPTADHAARAEEAVRKFQEEVGLEESLSDYGFSEGELEELTSRAMEVIAGDAWLVPFEVKPEIVRDVLRSAL
mgnify:CR=1 FL=1